MLHETSATVSLSQASVSLELQCLFEDFGNNNFEIKYPIHIGAGEGGAVCLEAMLI